jgi:hypothetical protein
MYVKALTTNVKVFITTVKAFLIPHQAFSTGYPTYGATTSNPLNICIQPLRYRFHHLAHPSQVFGSLLPPIGMPHPSLKIPCHALKITFQAFQVPHPSLPNLCASPTSLLSTNNLMNFIVPPTRLELVSSV